MKYLCIFSFVVLIVDNSAANPELRRLSMRRGTLEVLEKRRDSVLAMRNSIAPPMQGSSNAADIARARERRRESVLSWRDATT